MPHYYSEKQDTLNLKKTVIKDREFYTGAGVFSKKRLDKGTELLIEKSIIKENWSILDLGCGIGVVGLLIKLQNPTVNVLMTDINENAIKISKLNVRLNNLDIEVRKSNLFDKINENFNTILVNPPQTAGKEICCKIIEESKNHLKKQGLLQLVARHRKGGQSLKQKMFEVYGNADEIAKGSGYRIYVSKHLSTNT